MSANLRRASDEQLIEQYASLAKRVGDAIINWMPGAKLKQQLYALEGEIKARGARIKLSKLLSDNNRFVRYYAAQELYGLLPQQCRAIIEANTMRLRATRAAFCGRLTRGRTNRSDSEIGNES